MDLGDLKELSRLRIESQERIDGRSRLATEINAVVDALTALYEFKDDWGHRRQYSAEVDLAEPVLDQNGRETQLKAVIFQYSGDSVLTIHLANSPTTTGEGVYQDRLGSVPIATKTGGWNIPIPVASGELQFTLSDDDLEELHETVMAIGEASADETLNSHTAARMTEVMSEIKDAQRV
jgi:hypothetical protein